jgi:phosphatidate cytidylyltransferase
LARDLARPVPAPTRWADLRVRVLSAAVLVPLALACVWFGGAAFDLLMAVAALGLAIEWLTLGRLDPLGRSASERRGIAPGCRPVPLPTLLIGFLYIAIAGTSLAWLRAEPEIGRINLIVLLLLVWASDVGAYAVGRTVGGPPLAPLVSPGKTISGAIGGLAAAVATGLGAALALSQPPHLLRAGLVAAALGIVAQAGDLFESWVKRQLGVKDSGWLIPGHGGLFDRLDALLAAAPAAALLALWAGRGVAWWQ